MGKTAAKTNAVPAPQGVDSMPPPTTSFRFNKKHKAPAALAGLKLGDKVTVHLRGKVRRVSQDTGYPPENGPEHSLEVEHEGVDIEQHGPKNLKEARRMAMSRAEAHDRRS